MKVLIPFILGLPWNLPIWALMVVVRIAGGRDMRFQTVDGTLFLGMTFRGWARRLYGKLRAGATTIGSAVVYKDEQQRERADLDVHEAVHVEQFETRFVLGWFLSLCFLFVVWALSGRFEAGWRFAIVFWYLGVLAHPFADYLIGYLRYGKDFRFKSNMERAAYDRQELFRQRQQS